MANIHTIEVPKWGLTMEDGTLVKWLVSVGDSFHKGQELCEIETSKIVNVLEAPCDGVMCRFIAKIGETLPVGAVLAVCADQRISEEEADAWIKNRISPLISRIVMNRLLSVPLDLKKRIMLTLPDLLQLIHQKKTTVVRASIFLKY